MDSLATLDIPAVGYGIRYEFGMFKQTFVDGWQVERPDDWLFFGNPWEFGAPDNRQPVGFYGNTQRVHDENGRLIVLWAPGEMVIGEPSHILVPGYETGTVNIISTVARRRQPRRIRPLPVRSRTIRGGRRSSHQVRQHHEGALPKRRD
jgi:glucan phosphorylase